MSIVDLRKFEGLSLVLVVVHAQVPKLDFAVVTACEEEVPVLRVKLGGHNGLIMTLYLR